MLDVEAQEYLKNISVSEDYTTNFNTLCAVSLKLDELHVSDNIYKILLSYKSVNDLIDSIVSKKFEFIITKGASKLYNNKTFCDLINAYCVINNSFFSLVSSTDYYKFIDNINVLSVDDEKYLFGLLKSDDPKIKKKVRNIIIVCNLRFVRSFASLYSSKNTKLPFDELMEEGIIGLIKALDSFDVSTGNKFSTYAYIAIKQKIVSFCNRGTSSLGLSHDFAEKKVIYMKIKKDYIGTYGKAPSREYMKETFRLRWRNKLSDKALDELVNLFEKCSMDVYSLSMPLSDDNSLYLGDTIPDDSSAFYEDIERRELSDLFEKVFDAIKLDEREKEIICYLYGLRGYPLMKLREIKSNYGISYQRIQQVHKRILKSINKSENCRYILSGYYK